MTQLTWISVQLTETNGTYTAPCTHQHPDEQAAWACAAQIMCLQPGMRKPLQVVSPREASCTEPLGLFRETIGQKPKQVELPNLTKQPTAARHTAWLVFALDEEGEVIDCFRATTQQGLKHITLAVQMAGLVPFVEQEIEENA